MPLDINIESRNPDAESYKILSRQMKKDMTSFNRELKALNKAIESEYNRISSNVFADFFGTLVQRTPILTGNARLNWMINTSGVTGDFIPYPKFAVPIQDRVFWKKRLATKVKGYRSRGYTSKGQRVAGLFASAKSATVAQVTREKIKIFRDTYLKMKSNKVFIFNNAPHIEALENGTSKQAPNGMLMITVQDFSRLIKKHTTGSPIFRSI